MNSLAPIRGGEQPCRPSLTPSFIPLRSPFLQPRPRGQGHETRRYPAFQGMVYPASDLRTAWGSRGAETLSHLPPASPGISGAPRPSPVCPVPALGPGGGSAGWRRPSRAEELPLFLRRNAASEELHVRITQPPPLTRPGTPSGTPGHRDTGTGPQRICSRFSFGNTRCNLASAACCSISYRRRADVHPNYHVKTSTKLFLAVKPKIGKSSGFSTEEFFFPE